ncbi:MAG: glycoside hydrolase family 5 protein [Opitutaceae bacterium]|nr:glycoside hydrolase family 5 protein [Opitutaceae bacterium]
MHSVPLRALCALFLGGLSAFAQEKLHIHTFDRLPAALKPAQPTVTYGGTWAPDPENTPPADVTKRLTYEGLEFTGTATTNGFVTFTYNDASVLDLSRFTRIEVTVAGLTGNQLNPLTLELGSQTGGTTRRSVFYAGTAHLTRFGEKVVFHLDNPSLTPVWHRDGGVAYNRAAVKTITLGSNWPNPAGNVRVIIRDVHAVTDSLMEPLHFPNARIAGYGNWFNWTKDGNRINLPPGATASSGNGLYLGYVGGNPAVQDERDLTGYEYLDIEAGLLAGNDSDLRIDLKSIGNGASFWIIPRQSFSTNALTTLRINLRTPVGQSDAFPVNLSRIYGVLLSPAATDGKPVRWQIGGLRLVPAPAYTYRRGINISHWLSQNSSYFPYASPTRFRAALATHLSDLRRSGLVAIDHIRIPVEYQKIGNLGGTASNPTFTLINEEWQNGQLTRGIKPLEDAIAWARGENLGVILDLHSLPGLQLGGYAPETPHTLFADTNPNSLQRAQARAVWRTIAQRFANHGPWLRFELMNEPVRLPLGTVDSNTRVAVVQEDLRRVVRESNPNRVIYLTANDSGNRGSFWGLQLSQPRYPAFNTRPTTAPADPDALAFRPDKNVAYTIHYYDPVPLTHYGLPTGNKKADGTDEIHNIARTAAQLDAAFGPAGGIATTFSGLRWDLINPAATNHALLEYREVHVGEFGITKSAIDAHASLYPRNGFTDVRAQFMRRVRDEVENHGFAWSAWDYLNTEFSSFDGAGDTPAANTAGQALINP